MESANYHLVVIVVVIVRLMLHRSILSLTTFFCSRLARLPSFFRVAANTQTLAQTQIEVKILLQNLSSHELRQIGGGHSEV